MRRVFGSEVRFGRVSLSRDGHRGAGFGAASGLAGRELGTAIGAAFEQDMPASTIAEDLLRAQASSERSFFGGRELRSASYIPDLTLD
jgi:hypothetical protein